MGPGLSHSTFTFLLWPLSVSPIHQSGPTSRYLHLLFPLLEMFSLPFHTAISFPSFDSVLRALPQEVIYEYFF